MPELYAWIEHEPSRSHMADVLAKHAESRDVHTRGIPRELVPIVLHRVWLRGNAKEWSSLLGLGLVSMASAGNLQAVEQLLSAGATLTVTDRQGFTALHRAVETGHTDIVAELLGEEAKRDSRMPCSQPRLVFQQTEDSPKLIHAASMMRRGTVNVRNNAGHSPLHSAAVFGDEHLVRLLLDNNACPTDINRVQQTPLHYAAKKNSSESTALIIDRGGDVMARDSAGRTPLHDAAATGTEASMRALIRAGASTEVKASISGRTPLHEACARLRPGIVRVLLSLGADEGAVDNDGSKPSDLVDHRKAMSSCANLVEVANAILEMLGRAPADRKWRRRRLLLLLRHQPKLPKLEAEEVDWSQVDSYLWRIVLSTVELAEGAFREVVMFL